MSADSPIASADVLVVGAGVAGLSAATAAACSGQEVVVIEKSDRIGGTACFANGSIWIANHDLAKINGIVHDEQAELHFILSECWDDFDANKPWCGIGETTYKRVERYVSDGAKVIRDLTKNRIQTFTQLDFIFKSVFFSKKDSEDTVRRAFESKGMEIPHDLSKAASASWDYHWENEYNTVPYGKHIWASIDPIITSRFLLSGLKQHFGHIVRNCVSIRSFASLFDQIPKTFGKFWGFGHGLILVERFRRHLQAKRVQLLTNHRLIAVHTQQNRVVSVDVQSKDGQRTTWEVKQGLILASGCFSHQLPKRESQRFPIRSCCVATSNAGDANQILGDLDVQIDETPRPLLAQGVLQFAVRQKGVSHEPVFFLYGDSFFVVDRYGRRMMNEKLNYHDRAYHHVGDHDRELLFLIGDRRFKERNWGFGISLPFDSSLLIQANNPTSLADKINAEMKRNEFDFCLADQFASNLQETRDRFNEFARQGKDEDFGRGDNAYDVLGFPKADHDNDCPSRTMRPLSGSDLFCCILCLSVFSTHGGLACDADSRLLHRDGTPWQNMYAVGTCAASILNGRYPAHGMSIGTGLVFGYLAGLHATNNGQRLSAS